MAEETSKTKEAMNYAAIASALVTALYGVWQTTHSAKSDDVSEPLNACVAQVEYMHQEVREFKGFVLGINARLTAVEGNVYRGERVIVKGGVSMWRAPRMELPGGTREDFDRSMEQLRESPAKIDLPRYRKD
jgi:hypothetical protein